MYIHIHVLQYKGEQIVNQLDRRANDERAVVFMFNPPKVNKYYEIFKQLLCNKIKIIMQEYYYNYKII